MNLCLYHIFRFYFVYFVSAFLISLETRQNRVESSRAIPKDIWHLEYNPFLPFTYFEFGWTISFSSQMPHIYCTYILQWSDVLMPSSEMEISHLNGVNAYNQIDYTCASFARALNEHWQHVLCNEINILSQCFRLRDSFALTHAHTHTRISLIVICQCFDDFIVTNTF